MSARKPAFGLIGGALAMIGYYDDPRTWPLLGYPGPLLEQTKERQ